MHTLAAEDLPPILPLLQNATSSPVHQTFSPQDVQQRVGESASARTTMQAQRRMAHKSRPLNTEEVREDIFKVL